MDVPGMSEFGKLNGMRSNKYSINQNCEKLPFKVNQFSGDGHGNFSCLYLIL
jgi:hypothetical protein